MDNTKEIYNNNAARWRRDKPNSLSDFTARPYLFKLCGDVTGKKILDLGCGEGYCSQYLAENMGAKDITAVDISENMIKLANEKKNRQVDSGITYLISDINSLDFPDNTFDLILGIFVYNYLDIADMQASMKNVFNFLKPGGRFIFAVPHPSFPFMQTNIKYPFYFDFKNKGYFNSRNTRNYGSIFCLDGNELPVQMVHKLLEDYVDSMYTAGFSKMPLIKELGVTKDHLEYQYDFFSPIEEIPLHLAFMIQK